MLKECFSNFNMRMNHSDLNKMQILTQQVWDKSWETTFLKLQHYLSFFFFVLWYSSVQCWHHPCRHPFLLSSSWVWHSQVLLHPTHSAKPTHPVYHRVPAPHWKSLEALSIEMGWNSLTCPAPTQGSRCSVSPSPSASGPSLVSCLIFLLSPWPILFSVPTLPYTVPFLFFPFFFLRQKILHSFIRTEARRRWQWTRKFFLLALGHLMIFEGVTTQNAMNIA